MKQTIFLIIAFLAIAVAAQAQEEPRYDERESNPGEMMRRTRLQLQAESGKTPDALLEEWRQRIAARGGAKKGFQTESTTSIPTFNWSYLGPFNQSGHVNAVRWVPGTNDLVIGASGGGIWKRTKDSIWRAKTDSFPSLKMNCVATSPTSPGVMAMGTGDGFLYLSKDTGTTWNVLAKSPGRNIMSLAFHIRDAKTLYAATDDGLKVSRDQGATWADIVNSNRARSIMMHPTDSNIMYYGRMAWEWPNSTSDVMKTTDAGKTWNAMYTGRQSYWSNMLFGLCKAQPEVLWLGLDSAQKYYRSTNGGSAWTTCDSIPFADSYAKGFWMFVADPKNPLVGIAGGPALFRTLNGGHSWTRIDKNVHADFHSFDFGPGNSAIVCCDGGVYTTSDYLATNPVWDYKGNGLATLEAYNVAASPDGINSIVTGNQDNGYAKYTGDSAKWKIIGGDGFVTIFDQDNPLRFWHEYCSMNLHRAEDGFTWWSTKVMNGLPTTSDFYAGITSGPVDWYGQAIAIDPHNGDVLYCGSDTLYKTIDGGDLWTPLSADHLTNGNPMTAIAVSPLDSKLLWTGSGDGVVSYSTNTGGTWTHVPQAQFAGHTGRISNIALDTKSRKIAYVSMQLSAGAQSVFRTSDGGTSWAPITAGLPSATTSHLLIDPIHPDTLFIGTNVGLWTSTNHGISWSEVQGLPTVQVNDLAWQKYDAGGGTFEQALLVGTYGRGIIRGRSVSRVSYPDTILFASCRVGRSHDSTVLAMFRNAGTAPITLKNVRLADTTNFHLIGATSTMLINAGATRSMTLRFAPRSASQVASKLLFGEDGIDGEMSVQLIGTGTMPTIVIDPHQINFAPLYVGEKSTNQSIDVTEIGHLDTGDSVHITKIFLRGPGATDFLVSPTAMNLGETERRTVEAVFQPTSGGAKEAYVVVEHDGLGGSDSIVLVGAAIQSGVSYRATSSGNFFELVCNPNPAGPQSTLNVVSSEDMFGKVAEIEIFDIGGRLVRRVGELMITDNSDFPLETQSLLSGTYLIRATAEGKVASAWLVVRR